MFGGGFVEELECEVCFCIGGVEVFVEVVPWFAVEAESLHP